MAADVTGWGPTWGMNRLVLDDVRSCLLKLDRYLTLDKQCMDGDIGRGNLDLDTNLRTTEVLIRRLKELEELV